MPNMETVVALGAVVAGADPASRVPAEPRTAAAVLAADEAWGDAERCGNVAYVYRLLLPDYRSVGVRGAVTPKAAIVARARSATHDAAAVIKAADGGRFTRSTPKLRFDAT